MAENRVSCIGRIGAITTATLGLLVLVALGAPRAEAAVTSCPPIITACGCTITDGNLHTVANKISAADGLTSRGDCIDIKHPFATLEGDFNFADGAGSGVGVRILPGAHHASVQNLAVDGWDVGIEDDANSTNLANTCIFENGTAGLFLKSAHKTVVSSISGGVSTSCEDGGPSANIGAGILLKNSNNNTITSFDAYNNGADGVTLIGSNRNSFSNFGTDDNGGNGVTFKNSRKNSLTFFDSVDNAGDGVFIDAASSNKITGSFEADTVAENGANGIEIEKGGRNNSVVFNLSIDNAGFDLLDNNPTCDKNVWTNNCFEKASPACASNLFPECLLCM